MSIATSCDMSMVYLHYYKIITYVCMCMYIKDLGAYARRPMRKWLALRKLCR
jgi:hypothetical protein